MLKKFLLVFLAAAILFSSVFTRVANTVVLASGNPIVWGQPQEETGPDKIGSMTQVHGLIYGNGVFVVPTYGQGTSKILTSRDGKVWESKPILGNGPKGALQDVGFSTTGIFVAVGNNASINTPELQKFTPPTVIVSTDGGSSWTTDGIQFKSPDGTSDFTFPNPPGQTNFKCVLWDGGKFVAATQNALIFTSVNGFVWKAAASVEGPANFNDIAYSGSTYVAVGNGGVILTSADADIWTKVSSGTSQAIWGVAYGNGRFVASGNNGTLITSVDGTSWTSVKPNSLTADMRDIKWINNQFIAVGTNGKVLVSATGDSPEAWVDSSTPSFANTNKVLFGIAYDGAGMYVTAGDNATGAVIVSSLRATLAASTSVLSEANENDGSLASGSITVTLFDGTFAEDIETEGVAIPGLPLGLEYSVSRVSESQLTVNITGNAGNHANANDTTIAVVVSEAKITRFPGDASTGDLHTRPIAIDFNDPIAKISATPAVLHEGPANDGTLISGDITVTVVDGSFSTDITKADVTVTGLPTGMDYTISRDSETQLTVSLTGSANNHAMNNSTSIVITVAQAKVVGAIANVSTNSIAISFNNPDFTINVTPSSSGLTANQLFTADVTATNVSADNQAKNVLVVVALYDNTNAMRNVSYISRNVSYGASETISAGFKLPSNVAGHKVKIFVWEGNDIRSTTLKPISDVVTIQ